MRLSRPLLSGALIVSAITTLARAQDRGAALLDQQLRGVTVTPRVLIIGAHPDDENTALITWLARGKRVETAYLSLTRGESGTNAAGSDFGDVLGAVRTAEVLAARRIDGGRQYFTRAIDFGLSKSARETYDHWPHDAVLGDVVTVIRSFRPHVIVALFTGTPADSNGHHEVAGLLAREAFELAADTVQFPITLTGYPWEPAALYGPGKGLTIDVSGYDAVVGRTYGEITAESRAQHRTQGYPDSLLSGAAVAGRWVSVARIASRVTPGAATSGGSLFDGIDTTFARLAAGTPDTLARLITLIGVYADSARAVLDMRRPDSIVRYAARAAHFASLVRSRAPHCLHPDQDASSAVSSRAGCHQPWLELDASIDLVKRRAAEALLAAAGVSITMVADRELVAYTDSASATLTIANNGRAPVQFVTVSISGVADSSIRPKEIQPDSMARWPTAVRVLGSTEPWWMGEKIQDLHPSFASVLDGLSRLQAPTGLINVPAVAIPEEIRRASDVTVTMRIGGEVVTASVGPIIYRTADPLVGVQERPVSGLPSVGLGFDHNLEWIPLGKPIDRLLRFSLRSYTDAARKLTFGVVAPPGVRVESLPPSITLRKQESKELVLRLRGSIKEGRFMFGVIGSDADSTRFTDGIRTIQYPHLRPIRMSRGSAMWLKGVEIAVPSRLNVAYLQGTGDLITLYLRQLGVQINVLGYDELLNMDLSQFTTIVVGVRAYETHPELVAYNGKLLDFVRQGGTLVVQGGTNAIYNIGIFPYLLDAPPTGGVDRVTEEQAPVKVLNPGARILNWPNQITESDWMGWVTERAAYMPRVIDPRYTPLLEMHDPGEPPSRGALLAASLGRGTYIYTTLALHRQLQGAVSGGARLFVNLLSAGLAPEAVKRTSR